MVLGAGSEVVDCILGVELSSDVNSVVLLVVVLLVVEVVLVVLVRRVEDVTVVGFSD